MASPLATRFTILPPVAEARTALTDSKSFACKQPMVAKSMRSPKWTMAGKNLCYGYRTFTPATAWNSPSMSTKCSATRSTWLSSTIDLT